MQFRFRQIGHFTVSLTACAFVGEQLRDKAMEEELLKPGALDSPISVPTEYPGYSYKFLGKYRISHDWYGMGCHYHGPVVGVQGDIYEQDGHTFQAGVAEPKPQNIDRYTRPEWTANGYQGQPVTNKGFNPVCFESWYGTQHYISVALNRRTLDQPNVYGFKDGQISHQVIGKYNWWVQKFDLIPYQPNSAGRLAESWVLPVADTGYVFVFEFGANLESLNHPEAHAQMQAIFKHLIESVKIEPISAAAK